MDSPGVEIIHDTEIVMRQDERYSVLCHTCGKTLGRADSYPEAFGIAREHERGEDDGSKRRP